MSTDEIRKEVEAIIEKYCNGTMFTGLENAHFIEWSRDGSVNPKKCADEIVAYIEGLIWQLIKEEPYG